ncbi:MAG TPA: caspase family protein [Cyanophyceae cyanobacterium]
MPRIKRRQFLQFAGSALATMGLSQLDIMRQGDRYARVLAQDTPRKLALLVGINAYPTPIPSLQGCLNDIELQRELLLNRFGFNSNDIFTVSDRSDIKPTRQNILDAFENHLIKQAKPGDVVVFHYSGHGSQVIDPNPIASDDNLNGTLVPNDRMPDGNPDSPKVRDIMGRTLFLLMYALQTDNVTVVLDSCFSGGGTRGNLVFRSVPSRLGSGEAEASQEEFDYQERWLAQLNLSKAQFNELRRKGIAKGVALGSAQRNQLATDAPFGDFRAGAFTYLLTRYLWQKPESEALDSVFVNLQRRTQDVARSAGVEQEPIYEVAPGSKNDSKPIYFMPPTAPAAEAVVRKIEGEQIEFWLGGVSSQSLDSFREGAIFNLIDNKGRGIGEVEQTSRRGLVGYGKLRAGTRSLTPVVSGLLMRERVRGVPSDLKLRVGLDPSLGNELDKARTALQSVDRVEVVPVNQQSMVDYLLGRITPQVQQTGVANPPPVGSLGLFTAGLVPIPDSFDKAGESADAAVDRLRSRFKMLLAGRILRQVFNSEASDLKVSVTITPVGRGGEATSVGSRAAQEVGIIPKAIAAQKLKPDTEVRVQVQNNESKNLYISVLVIGSNGDIIVLYPVDWESPEEATLVAPKQILIVPPENSDFRFIVQGPSGFLELLVLASTEPLRDALRGLKQIANSRGTRSGDPLPLDPNQDEPDEVMGFLLGDLDRTTRAMINVTRGVRAVDTTQLAAISAVLEVVE